VVHKTFHCSPGVEQSHAVVIDDIAVLILRILFIARLKCIGSVNEVEIQILDTESVETRLESRFEEIQSFGHNLLHENLRPNPCQYRARRSGYDCCFLARHK
jgi:hypothetical protein